MIATKDRILDYLHHHDPDAYTVEGPYALTQDGIAEALGMTNAHVSSELRRLGPAVESKLLHVPGRPRRMRVYFATPRGRSAIYLRSAAAVGGTVALVGFLLWALRPDVAPDESGGWMKIM